MKINNTTITTNQVFWRLSLGFCTTPEKIENFDKVWEDQMNGVVFRQKWVVHHRREITEGKSRDQLIEEGNYYMVQPQELIYLLSSEHTRMHNLAKNPFGGKHHTDGWKKKHARRMRGKKNPFFGRQHTDETKKKISEAKKGKTLSEETKRKISIACKGHTVSEETRRKISSANRGRLKGMKLSEEAKRKISEGQTGMGWYNNGKISRKFFTPPDDSWTRGRVRQRK